MNIQSAFSRALKPIDASVARISSDAIEDKPASVLQEITAKFKNGDLITLARKSIMVAGNKVYFYELAYRELIDPVIKMKIFGNKKYFSVINAEFFSALDDQTAVEAFSMRTVHTYPKLATGIGLKSYEEIPD